MDKSDKMGLNVI